VSGFYHFARAMRSGDPVSLRLADPAQRSRHDSDGRGPGNENSGSQVPTFVDVQTASQSLSVQDAPFGGCPHLSDIFPVDRASVRLGLVGILPG
jgi:hypothetical protein